MKWLLAFSAFLVFLPCVVEAQSASFNLDHNVLQEGPNAMVNVVISAPYDGDMSLEIFNSAGELVKNFKNNSSVTANVPVTIQWDGTNTGSNLVASGVYFFLLKLPLGTQTKRLLVIH